jgi:hypothetical protein
MKTKLILLAALFILSFSPANAGIVKPVFDNGTTSKQASYCGVTCEQIYEYMMGYGYIVNQFSPVTGSCDVKVKVSTGQTFIVHIGDAGIVGYEEWQG